MKLRRILCIICVLAVPSLALDREAFTFTNYDLNVRVEPDQQRLGVRGKLTLRNDSSAAQKNIALQISSTLDWRSVQAEGKALDFVTHEYTSDIDHTGALSEAIVTLPREVPSKGTIELSIGYEGVIPLDVTRLTRIGVPEDKAKHTDWDQISKSFTAVRGVGYVAWYPVATESANLSEGNSVFETLGRWKTREAASTMLMRLCEVHAAGSSPYLIVGAKPTKGSAGRKATGSSCGDDYVFESLGLFGPTFALAGYSVLDRQDLTIYHFAEHKPGAESYALGAELAIPLVSEWFGPPKQKAEVAELGDSEGVPFESGSMLIAPLVNNDSRAYQLTAVHQLTHAAFFSSRLWIYEGLAHFAQALEREQLSGRQAALDFMARHGNAIADAEKTLAATHSQNESANESLINTSTEEFHRSKAMYVWWMLRDMVGETALKKALAAYHADQDKEASDVQHLIEAQTHRDLQWFFDDWVYRDRGLPDFRIESAYPRAKVDSGYLTTITIENLGDAGAEVPVTLRMEGGEVSKRLEVRAKSKAVVRIETGSTPLEVIVNDGSVPESDISKNVFKVPPPDATK